MRRQDVIDKISHNMRLQAPEASVILYGSQARGDARYDSDIDLLVLLPDFEDNLAFEKRRYEIAGYLYDISLDMSADISYIIMPRSAWEERVTPFRINVNREGVRL